MPKRGPARLLWDLNPVWEGLAGALFHEVVLEWHHRRWERKPHLLHGHTMMAAKITEGHSDAFTCDANN